MNETYKFPLKKIIILILALIGVSIGVFIFLCNKVPFGIEYFGAVISSIIATVCAIYGIYLTLKHNSILNQKFIKQERRLSVLPLASISHKKREDIVEENSEDCIVINFTDKDRIIVEEGLTNDKINAIMENEDNVYGLGFEITNSGEGTMINFLLRLEGVELPIESNVTVQSIPRNDSKCYMFFTDNLDKIPEKINIKTIYNDIYSSKYTQEFPFSTYYFNKKSCLNVAVSQQYIEEEDELQ